MRIKCSSLSEIGLKRKENQDRILSLHNGELGLFVVADGMGGHSDGAYASEKIISEFEIMWNNILQTGCTLEELTEQALSVINNVNSEIFNYSVKQKIICGSTISVLIICGSRYTVINAGDSPVFMVSKHISQHITVEHSYGEMIKKSGMRENNISSYSKNHLTKAVGVSLKFYPDVYSNSMEERSVFLLCSDGVSRYFSDKEIFKETRRVIKQVLSCQEMLNRIKKCVYKNGAADNFSAISVDCLKADIMEDNITSTRTVLTVVIFLVVFLTIMCSIIFAVQLLL